MRRLLQRLHRDQAGFTLPELLTATAVGLVVLTASLLLLDHSTSISKQISDRQDAVQRGRIAMESMTRELRSQVCLGDQIEPITYGDNNKVTFYADLSATNQIEQRTLTYDSVNKQITESVVRGTGTYPELSFTSAPRTRVLLKPVQPINDGATVRPVLRYYSFKAGGAAGDLQQLAVPLSGENAASTVMVKVGFVALPDTRTQKNLDATTFESDVYVRLADPSRPTEGPRCI